MIVPAISVGYAVPKTDFEGIVHSVFRNAINLRCTPDDSLLTIFAARDMDLPHGVHVDIPEDFSFEVFAVGEVARRRENLLHIGSMGIDLRGARSWKCDLPSLQIDLAVPDVVAAWRFAWRALSLRQMESSSEIAADRLFRSDGVLRSAVAERASNAMRDLVVATRRSELQIASSSVGALIGLGHGLTPSGDDLLVGYIAGLWCTVRSNNERVRFVENLGDMIAHQAFATNEISRAYLGHAIRGQVSSALANLASAVTSDWNPNRLLRLADCAMRVGHTSGMDAVTGLLVGIAAWDFPLLFQG